MAEKADIKKATNEKAGNEKANGEAQPRSRRRGVHLAPYQVILRPLVTEKGMHRAETYNQYSFAINPLASKDDVRRAIEELFDVKVVKVRTQTRKGKPRRFRFVQSQTKEWKKAIVTLSDEHRINFF